MFDFFLPDFFLGRERKSSSGFCSIRASVCKGCRFTAVSEESETAGGTESCFKRGGEERERRERKWCGGHWREDLR